MKKIGMFLAAMCVLAERRDGCDRSEDELQPPRPRGSSSENSATEVAGGPTITIANMAFGQPLTVAPGTKINIANNDTMEHSVTSETEGAFDARMSKVEQRRHSPHRQNRANTLSTAAITRI